MTFVIQDLKPTHGLAEQERDGAQISVAGGVHLPDQLILFRRPRGVVHVSQVVLALDVVLVLPDELILIVEFEKQRKELEKLDNDFVVTFLETAVSTCNYSWVRDECLNEK